MARLVLLAMLITLVAAMASGVQAQDDVKWAKRVDSGKEVVSTLQFYFHDVLSGRNPSAVRIAQASQANSTPNGFGSLMMVDDPLTVGPDPNSRLVGRARGMYGSAGQTDFGLVMVMCYEFLDGTYKDSSFSILSINPALNPVREMTVVGGTGLFRLARGYAIAQTYSLDPTTGDAVVGYNVTLATYI
ncbi:unnamed protein product [Coffea canephora]|uniref:Dirigent protein n=1 Tax=Coffea canephora TaxID=49390 RepID=A0A068UTY9_COFCA|nr:unnamed protein product [Coffea canephora]